MGAVLSRAVDCPWTGPDHTSRADFAWVQIGRVGAMHHLSQTLCQTWGSVLCGDPLAVPAGVRTGALLLYDAVRRAPAFNIWPLGCLGSMLGCGILCSYSWCHDSGFLRRVGLDVFEDEPKMKPGLAECDNAVIVPHIASASFWTRSAMVCTPFTYLAAACMCRLQLLLWHWSPSYSRPAQ